MRKLYKRIILFLLLTLIVSLIGRFTNKAIASLVEETLIKRVEKQELFSRELTQIEQQKIFLLENFGDYKTYKLMVRIAECESGFNQEAVNRKTMDIGLFQINLGYHLENSKKLGYDIYDWKGNIKYAFYLYKNYGTKPWNWSRQCWQR